MGYAGNMVVRFSGYRNKLMGQLHKKKPKVVKISNSVRTLLWFQTRMNNAGVACRYCIRYVLYPKSCYHQKDYRACKQIYDAITPPEYDIREEENWVNYDK